MTPGIGDVARLAQLVTRRRAQLGLRQDEVYARGGPASTTLAKIEQGLEQTYRPQSLSKLDAALGWERGSCQRILDGGDPQVARQTQAEFVLVTMPDWLEEEDRERARVLAQQLVDAAMETFRTGGRNP